MRTEENTALVMYNTLFPEKLTSLSPLYYYGTRAELENELLHIQVCSIGTRGGARGGGLGVTRDTASLTLPASPLPCTQVFDWDAGSRNDLLGFADVPLRGVLQNGYISAALGLPSTEKGSGKKGEKKKTMAAGSGGKDSAVAGKIELLGTPRYAQFGDVVHRIPGMTYLALHVISAKGLLSRSEDVSQNCSEYPDTF